MKKIVSILILLLILTGCGSNNVENTSNNVKKEVSIDDILNNKNNYFVKINGVKLTVGDKVSDVLKTGYTMKDKDLAETVPSNRYLLSKSVIGKEEYRAVFRVTPLNLTSSTVTVKDAAIGGFEVGEVDYDKIYSETLGMDIEIYGGLKLGSTYDDMVKVFGTDYTFYDANPDGESDKLTYKSYKYEKSYKGFEFIFDKNGKLSEIKWRNYSYNE